MRNIIHLHLFVTQFLYVQFLLLATPINVAIFHSGNSINPKYFQSDPVKYATKFIKKLYPKFNNSGPTLGGEIRQRFWKLPELKIQEAADEVSIIPLITCYYIGMNV